MGKGPSGSGLAECAAWPVIVVMVRVLLQHGRGVSLVDDQQGVEEFPAEGAEEAIGDRVGPRCPRPGVDCRLRLTHRVIRTRAT